MQQENASQLIERLKKQAKNDIALANKINSNKTIYQRNAQLEYMRMIELSNMRSTIEARAYSTRKDSFEILSRSDLKAIAKHQKYE